MTYSYSSYRPHLCCSQFNLTLHVYTLDNGKCILLLWSGKKLYDKDVNDTNWLQVSAQPVLILYSAPQSLKTPRRLENFTKYQSFLDMSHCQQLYLEDSSSQRYPRLEAKKKRNSWRGREWRKRDEGERQELNANKSEHSFPRLLRFEQFSND